MKQSPGLRAGSTTVAGPGHGSLHERRTEKALMGAGEPSSEHGVLLFSLPVPEGSR